MNKGRGKYSSRMEWSTKGLHNKILKLIPSSKGIAVDLACGSGNLPKGLLKKGNLIL